jgi:hypothetical protein
MEISKYYLFSLCDLRIQTTNVEILFLFPIILKVNWPIIKHIGNNIMEFVPWILRLFKPWWKWVYKKQSCITEVLKNRKKSKYINTNNVLNLKFYQFDNRSIHTNIKVKNIKFAMLQVENQKENKAYSLT